MIDTNNKDEIFKAICDLLEKDFECPKDKLVPHAMLFEDLDLDSIDAVDLIVKLQKMVQVKVDPEAFKQIRTLGDVTDAIHSLLSEK